MTQIGWIYPGKVIRNQNHVDVFFLMEVLKCTLHHHSHPLPWYQLKYFFVVSTTNHLFTHGRSHWLILRSRGSLPGLWVLWSSNRWEEGKGKPEVAYTPPIPTLHLFSQPHMCFSDTPLDPSYHNRGEASKVGLVNRYFSKDEHSVKTELYFYFKWQICYSENEAWVLEVKELIMGSFGCGRLLICMHLKWTALSTSG